MTLFKQSKVAKVLAVAALSATAFAEASTVTFETASSIAPSQTTADAYRTVVSAAVTNPDAKKAVVPAFDNLSNQSVFGNSVVNNNRAQRTTVDFSVSTADAGLWGLRIGGDFGHGAAVFLDGVALGFNPNNIFWNGSYADATQSFQFPSVLLTQGAHKLVLYSLEDCCDYSQQGQFSIKGATYKTFGSTDGLATPVPEPQSYALLLAGLAAVGSLVWRRGGVAAQAQA